MNQENKKKFDFGKLLNLVLIAVVIILVMNKFVFSGTAGGGNQTLSQKGLEYYMENYGSQADAKEIEAVVRNLGCHQEIHIYQSGQLVMRLSYFSGQIYEL